MLFSMQSIIALALTSIALAHTGPHGRPFMRRNAHASITTRALSERFVNSTTLLPTAAAEERLSSVPSPSCGFWLEDIAHQGFSPFNTDPGSYRVFRNVKDFGAVGDGIADDTAAINNAISSGGRCSPVNCQSSTVTPAIVYLPPGTYVVSAAIVVFYKTQLVGNPSCLPIIQASPIFSLAQGYLGIIDGDPYVGSRFGSTNTFYRQIRNLVIDMTHVPANQVIRGIHWPTAQATSLQNIVFEMSDAAGTQHQGLFIEDGSGGFMSDLVFNGGLYGVNWGNQQFTVRNLTFNNAVTAIYQIWDWGWTYKSITINNCTTGLNMTSLDPSTGRQTVGSITFIDSSITNTGTGIANGRGPGTQPPTAGSLIIENVDFTNVGTGLVSPAGTSSLGASPLTATGVAFGTGHSFDVGDFRDFDGDVPGFNRPSNLLQSDGKYYERSKPHYADQPLEMIYSVRNAGAKGDGVTDDTATLQRVINRAAFLHKILFFDFGVYRVTRTLYIPPGSRIVGETYPIILSSGRFFANINNPQPVVQIGHPGDKGSVEWSDMIVSTQGRQPGAVLIEINLESPSGSPSGLWDVHTRIGGFTGSFLQLDDCPKTPNVATPASPVNSRCIAAFLGVHITKRAAGVYLENVWVWTADHDLDDPSGQNTQITIYTGRGLLVESENGPVWLVGTAVEHFQLYQYQFTNTKNIFAGQVQTETAYGWPVNNTLLTFSANGPDSYYQPNPNATLPFLPISSLSDPDFSSQPLDSSSNVDVADSWGLRVLNSENILIYGAGLYSFFTNYNNTCAVPTDSFYCQSRILSVEGSSSNFGIYNLNTIGTESMADRDGPSIGAAVAAADNINVYPDTLALLTFSL